MPSVQLETDLLTVVFQSRPEILRGIQAAADTSERIALFNAIGTFVHEQLPAGGSAAKRRRVDELVARPGLDQALTLNPSSGPDGGGEPCRLCLRDVSLAMPQRKKVDMYFTPSGVYACLPGTMQPCSAIGHEWKTIEHGFCLPVPERSQPAFNYVLLPHGSDLNLNLTPKSDPAMVEPVLFTVPACAAAAPGSNGGAMAKTTTGSPVGGVEAAPTMFHDELVHQIRRAGSKMEIVTADGGVFQTPSQKQWVRAYRGTKDGFLFFLRTGILWGFKKPLVFVPLDRIAAVSYTNVLKVTFNLVVEVLMAGGRTEEVEFSMIDQIEHGAIDQQYVRRLGLQNRSLGEQRKAKFALAENARAAAKKGEADATGSITNGGEDNGTGEVGRDGGETAPAQEAGVDEEDEEEEDYEPGSDESDYDDDRSSSDGDDQDGSEDSNINS